MAGGRLTNVKRFAQIRTNLKSVFLASPNSVSVPSVAKNYFTAAEPFFTFQPRTATEAGVPAS